MQSRNWNVSGFSDVIIGALNFLRTPFLQLFMWRTFFSRTKGFGETVFKPISWNFGFDLFDWCTIVKDSLRLRIHKAVQKAFSASYIRTHNPCVKHHAKKQRRPNFTAPYTPQFYKWTLFTVVAIWLERLFIFCSQDFFSLKKTNINSETYLINDPLFLRSFKLRFDGKKVQKSINEPVRLSGQGEEGTMGCGISYFTWKVNNFIS